MNILSKNKIIASLDDIRDKSDEVYTNIYLNDWWIDYVDKCSDVEYDYVEGKYLNIYLPVECENEMHHLDKKNSEKQYKRLYFISNDINSICLHKNFNIVTDYFESNKNIKNEVSIVNSMQQIGLKEYATYTKWNLKINEHISKKVTIDEEKFLLYKRQENSLIDDKIYIAITKNFDLLSDNIPYREYIFKNKKIYICMDKIKNQLAGFAIYKVDGKNVVTEYVCILDEYRSKNLATLIFDKLYDDVKDNAKIFSSWISDNNAASIEYHKSLGYKITDIKKYTFNK